MMVNEHPSVHIQRFYFHFTTTLSLVCFRLGEQSHIIKHATNNLGSSISLQLGRVALNALHVGCRSSAPRSYLRHAGRPWPCPRLLQRQFASSPTLRDLLLLFTASSPWLYHVQQELRAASNIHIYISSKWAECRPSPPTRPGPYRSSAPATRAPAPCPWPWPWRSCLTARPCTVGRSYLAERTVSQSSF